MRCQMSDRAVADGPAMHPGWSARTLKMIFTEPITFGFFLVFQRPDGPRLVSDGARFSIGRSVVLTCVFAGFLSKAHPSVTDGPPQGPGRFDGIPDYRRRIVVDELMHLRNDQLGKLVSP
jgi:hypothetical protein